MKIGTVVIRRVLLAGITIWYHGMVFLYFMFYICFIKQMTRVIKSGIKKFHLIPLLGAVYGIVAIVVFSMIGIMQSTQKVALGQYNSLTPSSSMISWHDDFNTQERIDKTRSKGLRWFGGRVEMSDLKSVFSSTCARFEPPTRPAPTVLDTRTEYRDLEIEMYFLSRNVKGSIELQYCDGQTARAYDVSIVKEGVSVFDISDINQEKARRVGVRLLISTHTQNIFMSPFSSRPTLHKWGVWGQNSNIARVMVAPLDTAIRTGRNNSVSIEVSPLLSDIPPSLLQISIIPYFSNPQDSQLLSLFPNGDSNRGESAIGFDSYAPTQTLSYQLDVIKLGSLTQLSVDAFMQQGGSVGDYVVIKAELLFGPRYYDVLAQSYGLYDNENNAIGSKSINVPRIWYPDKSVKYPTSIQYTSSFLTIESTAKVNTLAYDRYSNLSPDADNLWTTYFIEDNGLVREPNRVYADGKNMLMVIDLAAGSCMPVYKGVTVKKLLDNDNFYALEDDFGRRISYDIISEPQQMNVVSARFGEERQRYVLVQIHQWDWESIYYGVVVDYDVKGGEGCEESSQLQFETRLYSYNHFTPEDISLDRISFDTFENREGFELWDTEIRSHPIVYKRCSLQQFPSRDVVRISQDTFKPQDAYWPELRISREANCYRDDNYKVEIDENSPYGYVKEGEYVLVNYWMNEGYREQTIESVDWFYVINELQGGTSFHGTQLDMSIRNNDGNFYPQRMESKLSSDSVQYFKGDLRADGVLLPQDAGFDHENPEKSGWFPVTVDNVPLLGEGKMQDPNAPVYYSPDHSYAILARVKDLEPAWKRDFFLPTFLTRICDGSYACDAPQEGTVIKLNSMDVYSFANGTCEYCGETQFGTVKVGAVSFPQVLLFAPQEIFKPRDSFEFIINPENLALASDPVWGEWGFDLSELKDYINWDSVSFNVTCVECTLPKECSLRDIMKHYAINREKGEVSVDLNETPQCFIDTATGYKNLADFCRDAYNQSFKMYVSGSFSSYSIKHSTRARIKGFVRNVHNKSMDVDAIHKNGTRQVTTIPLTLRP